MNYYFKFGDLKFQTKFDLCSHIGLNQLKLEDLHNSSFVPYNNFNNYVFKRIKNSNFEDVALKRLKQLREQYSFIRLWYSGGKDSHIILHLAEKYNIKFDEILSFPNAIYGKVELQNVDKLIPKYYHEENKFLKIVQDPKHYNMVYRNSDWWKHTPYWGIQMAMHNPLMYRFILPELKEIQFPKNRCELIGGEVPTIWKDKDNWNFIFNEYEFNSSTFDTCENFIFSSEILESYVNNIINSLEKQKYVYNFGDTLSFLRKKGDSKRWLRDQIPIFKELKVDKQLDKELLNAKINIKLDDFNPYSAWISTKEKLVLEKYYDSNEEFIINYKKTDWKTIKLIHGFGTINTKIFKLIN